MRGPTAVEIAVMTVHLHVGQGAKTLAAVMKELRYPV